MTDSHSSIRQLLKYFRKERPEREKVLPFTFLTAAKTGYEAREGFKDVLTSSLAGNRLPTSSHLPSTNPTCAPKHHYQKNMSDSSP